MATPFLSLEQISKVYKIEQDWLFAKLLAKLNGFHLAEKNLDIHTCLIDLKPAIS